jgi:hypothetical protein
MTPKHPLRPDRLRRIPPSFSWVDHRLIREQHLRGCNPCAWALYLFLITVADSQGLSYYSDASVSRILQVDLMAVTEARRQLVHSGLVAYRKPLYQVLDLEPGAICPSAPQGETLSVAAVPQKVMGGAR